MVGVIVLNVIVFIVIMLIISSVIELIATGLKVDVFNVITLSVIVLG